MRETVVDVVIVRRVSYSGWYRRPRRVLDPLPLMEDGRVNFWLHVRLACDTQATPAIEQTRIRKPTIRVQHRLQLQISIRMIRSLAFPEEPCPEFGRSHRPSGADTFSEAASGISAAAAARWDVGALDEGVTGPVAVVQLGFKPLTSKLHRPGITQFENGQYDGIEEINMKAFQKLRKTD
ncbi:hypothetical protein B0H19DRAFT_1065876 [Mycena capillaripes]|nr:hypothetical protein B0H19DRAFT_1065876 [Mycena capillaripes]